MRRLIVPLLLAVMLTAGVAACKPGVPAPYSLTEDAQALASGNTEFAVDLYHAIQAEAEEVAAREERDERNLFVSPYSVSEALAMAYAGARRQTADEMAEVLHFTLPQETLHPAFLDLRTGLRQIHRGDDPRLHIADAVWGQQGYDFADEYVQQMRDNYGAPLRRVDFAGDLEGCRQAINAWVAEQTEDRISELIERQCLPPDAALVLTNAVCFKAAWVHMFDESRTGNAPFMRLDGREVMVPMMRHAAEVELPFMGADGYAAVELPYANCHAGMVIIVPDAGTFQEFESALTAKGLTDILDSLYETKVKLTLPKFRGEWFYNLTTTLADMGMPSAFSPTRADFSGLNSEQRRDLYIAAVLHKTFLEVDERGTEAAAGTAVIFNAAPFELTVDRPFLFLIRDRATGTILFLGRVLDPTN